MQDNWFIASKLSFLLALAMNKKVVKAEVSFLGIENTCFYNSSFFYNCKT